MSQQQQGSKLFPKIAFTAVAIIAFVFFKNFGVNKLWFEKVGGYWDAFVEQKSAGLTQEEIKRERLGGPYVISKMIQEYFEKNKIKNPVVLTEPNDYLLENKILSFKMPEPIIFYNYTGLKLVWMNSRNVKDATYFVRLRPEGLQIEPIKSPEELQTIISQYKKYTPSI